MKINYDSKYYPNKLRNISNPPKQIFAVGNIDILNSFSIAIIGSRNCTTYGVRMTKRFIKGLAKYNINTVSGLAVGIDKCVHVNTIEEKMCTIAVLPCGLNNIYPKEHKMLVKKIVASGGCVITEYENEISATSKQFLERNRIITGISDGVLIVEGGYRSGTSVTAKIAKKQSKKIFCIPSSLENPKGIVPNNLIKNGAILVIDETDIIKNYKGLEKQEKKKTKNIICNNECNKIYSILNEEGMTIDEIVNKTKLKVAEVNYQLMILELDGCIEQLSGKRYRRR